MNLLLPKNPIYPEHLAQLGLVDARTLDIPSELSFVKLGERQQRRYESDCFQAQFDADMESMGFKK